MTDPNHDLPPEDMKAALEYLYGPLPINEGEGLLHHLKANPTLLDPAPEDRDVWAAAMDHRAYDEKQPRRLKIWEPDTEIDPFSEPDPIRVLNVQKVAAGAPWTERPYRYVWRVAVGPDGRWVAAEHVEVLEMYGGLR